MTQAYGALITNQKLGRSDENVQAISTKESADLFKVGTTAVKDAKRKSLNTILIIW
ncbi:MAG: hypothetical protein GWP19_06635 [Planctomycetia bacterium]|nr:hypothetical protein [Planctomycetia bacterium]